MGLKNGSYMTVWETRPGRFEGQMNVRLSSSYKNKNGDYVNDFNGFVDFYAKAAADAQNLKHGDRIKIVSCDTCNSYDKEKDRTYWNLKVFAFEMATPYNSSYSNTRKDSNSVDSNPVEDDETPF